MLLTLLLGCSCRLEVKINKPDEEIEEETHDRQTRWKMAEVDLEYKI